MTEKSFCEMLETTEPYFYFRGIDYQICAVNGGFLAGESDHEDEDIWFATKDDLLYKWKLQGIALIDALPEIEFL